MQFFTWNTDYALYKRSVSNPEPYDRFLTIRRRELKEAGVVPVRLYVEDEWTNAGSPYYSIHPRLASKLCKVDLSKIPSHMIKIPHGQKIVHIRLAEAHPEFTLSDSFSTDETNLPKYNVPVGSFCKGLLMGEDFPKSGGRYLNFVVEFDAITQYNQPVYLVFRIHPREEVSVAECLAESVRNRSASHRFIVENIMRLAVTVGFLSDNPTICEPDVLSRDKYNFEHGDEEKRQVIIARARRKGKLGYTIGTDLMFLGERPVGQRRDHKETGRELEYAHIRMGHPHAVRHGEGKKLVKIMWYVPTTVRADLPFKPEGDP